MKAAYIFVDNLRIGGYQRLALDEAYEMADQGIQVYILSLEEFDVEKTFYANEKTEVTVRNIIVKKIPVKRIEMTIFLLHEFKNGIEPDLIISHSLRSTFAIWILSFSRRKITSTKIHQIPKLSDKKQRIKRFVYSQFATNLYSFSEAATQSWYEQFNFGSKLLKKYTRQIQTVRNGVYLGRLPQIGHREDGKRRLIFLGRPTFWKGLDILQKLAEREDLKDFEFLFIVPSFDEKLFSEIRKTLGDRLGFVEGKSFGDLELFEGDVHLYPSQYGKQVNRFESVSINCLEMACLGIPSLVTIGGNLTWREHEFSKIFIEVDWSNLEDVASKIKETSKIRFDSTDLHYFKGKIDVKNELKAVVKEK